MKEKECLLKRVSLSGDARSVLKDLVIPPEILKEQTKGGRVTDVCEKSKEGRTTYLEVTGVIDSVDSTAPYIGWKILLPGQWNLRSVQIGGGANNGSVPSLDGAMLMSNYRPIEHGYVVFGDDSGHQSEDPMSAEFAANEESLQNYIRQHLIKMNGVMHAVVKAAYGVDAEKVYFAGGSAGGREALECACSYGKDYDGIFCADPVSNFVLLRMWGALLSKAVYDSYDKKNHPHSDGFIDEKTVEAIRNDAIEMMSWTA